MYKVAQWGAGNVGRHALRMLIERPSLELVALRVYDPSKVGIDAGLLVNESPVGVAATDDADAVLASDADCVVYTALSDTSGNDVLGDLTRLLAAGKNVVSTAGERYAYVRPEVDLDPQGRRRLEQACAEGGTSFYVGGINPGFAMDQWPIAMSRMCRQIDHMDVTEIVDCRGYDSSLMRNVMGFGLRPDAENPLDRHLRDVKNTTFYLSLRMLGDALGVRFDDVTYARKSIVTDKPLETATGRVEAGTIAAHRLRIDGVVDGQPRVSLHWVWSVGDRFTSERSSTGFTWRLRVQGDPNIESDIELETATDVGRPTSLATAALLVNALPAVCEAPPGLIDNLNLPQHGGGVF